ncbi:MAG TPA: RDD family protein [Dehalococcoidia bacterium]|nr:RDD family protein [Dehalococcoidia bacterium]
MQPLNPEAPLSPDLELAPIGLRLFAFVLDAAIAVVLVLTVGSFAVTSGVSVGTAAPAMVVVAAAYNIGFVAAAGATPGKTAVGLKVAGRDGLRPSPDAAVLRFLAYFVLGALFPFGTIANLASMFADAQRRTFPDRIAGTVVLRELRAA